MEITARELEIINTTTAADIATASDSDLRDWYRVASKHMDGAMYGCYDEAINEKIEALYWAVTAEEDERYRVKEEPRIREYFRKWFAGKDWDEIRNDETLYDNWGYYSDWHKDVFGYRPHAIVCGTYVNPHA